MFHYLPEMKHCKFIINHAVPACLKSSNSANLIVLAGVTYKQVSNMSEPNLKHSLAVLLFKPKFKHFHAADFNA
jgi:hypothetical protein